MGCSASKATKVIVPRNVPHPVEPTKNVRNRPQLDQTQNVNNRPQLDTTQNVSNRPHLDTRSPSSLSVSQCKVDIKDQDIKDGLCVESFPATEVTQQGSHNNEANMEENITGSFNGHPNVQSEKVQTISTDKEKSDENVKELKTMILQLQRKIEYLGLKQIKLEQEMRKELKTEKNISENQDYLLLHNKIDNIHKEMEQNIKDVKVLTEKMTATSYFETNQISKLGTPSSTELGAVAEEKCIINDTDELVMDEPERQSEKWRCPDCNYANDRDKCALCETKKIWKCRHCTSLNPVDKYICMTCGKSDKKQRHILCGKTDNLKEENEIEMEMWDCIFCTTKNPNSVRFCKVCGKTKSQETMWDCIFCTTKNPNSVRICKVCGKTKSQETIETSQSTQDDYLADESIQQQLKPFLEAIDNEEAELAKCDKDGEDAQMFFDITQNAAIVSNITNKRLPAERRMRIILAEGNLQDITRAENAIKLIDDDEVFGNGVTIRHVIDAVRLGDGGYDESKLLLRKECMVCKDSIALDRLQQLTCCECRMCTDCFEGNFTTLIKGEPVVSWTCTVCKKPDIENDKDHVIEGHFVFLGIKVQRFLDKNMYELFNKKLNEWKLNRYENFMHCPNDKCTSGFIHGEQLRVLCRECKKEFCWKCKINWDEGHNGASCEEFRKKLIERGENTIKKELQKKSIICPNPKCSFHYELAKGGCLHFECRVCKVPFCGSCLEVYRKDKKKGLTCHHPRNCFYHLRDWNTKRLLQLLKENQVNYRRATTGEGHCAVQITVEENGEWIDKPCEGEVRKGQNGLCRKHFKEDLVQIIQEKAVDPVNLMDKEEITALLKRSNIRLPSNVDDANDLEKLKELVRQKLPLNKKKYGP